MNSQYALVLSVHFVCVFIALRTLFSVAPTFLTDLVDCSVNLTLTALFGWFTWQFTKAKWLNNRVQPDGKAVLITGCDRGFGHALAIQLDSLGYHVFASCLFPSGPGAEELKTKCSSRLQVLELDVTKEESVQAALKFVEENLSSSDLWAVVNNAGILKGISVEFSPIQDFKDNIEVNTYGPLRVNKAFLPLLRQSKGRIISVTSLIGRMSLPHFTPYTMSKFAAVGLHDCLRQELEIWGVKVITIEPEIYKTGMTDKNHLNKYLEATIGNLDESVKADYGDDYFKSHRKLQNSFIDLGSSKTESVVDDLVEAVTNEHPDRVYSPRRNALFRCFLFVFKIAPLVVQDAIVKIGTYVVLFKKLKLAAR